LELIIFFAAVLLLSYIIFKAKMFKQTGIPVLLLLVLLALKFGSGLVVNNYYFDRYEEQKHSDIHKYSTDGHELYKIALENPKAYFKIFCGLYENDPSTVQYVNRLKNWKSHTGNYVKTMGYQEAKLFSSSRSMARINSLVFFVSRGHLPTQTLIFSFLSFCGIALLFVTFLKNLSVKNWISFSILCLAPSLLIWTSSIQKESLIILGIGLISHTLFSKNKNIISLFMGAILLLYVSYFTLLILMLSWFLMALYRRSSKLFFTTIGAAFVAFILLSTLNNFNPMKPITSRYNLQNKIGKGGYYLESLEKGNIVYFEFAEFEKLKNTLNVKNQNSLTCYELTGDLVVLDFQDGTHSDETHTLNSQSGWYYQKLKYVPAKSYVEHKILKSELMSFLSHTGSALIHTVAIPYYHISTLTIPFYIESILLFTFLLFLLFNNFKIKNLVPSSENMFILLFILTSLLLIGYSTPIVGNIIRHKAPAMALLIIMALRVGFKSKA